MIPVSEPSSRIEDGRVTDDIPVAESSAIKYILEKYVSNDREIL